jgi:hypothetical protein
MRSVALVLTVAACGGTKPTPAVSDVRAKAPPVVTPNDDGGSNTIALAGGYTLRVGFGTGLESSTSETELDTVHVEVVRDADASIVWQRAGVDAVAGPGIEEAHFARCDQVRALGGGFVWGETSGEVQGSTLVQHITDEERAPEGKAGCATRESTRTARVPIRR